MKFYYFQGLTCDTHFCLPLICENFNLETMKTSIYFYVNEYAFATVCRLSFSLLHISKLIIFPMSVFDIIKYMWSVHAAVYTCKRLICFVMDNDNDYFYL